jgi:hypothetical protein
MKKIFIVTAVSAAALLGACGSTANTSKTTTPAKKVTKTKAPVKIVSYGFNASGTVLTLPHVGQASPTITKFAVQDKAFYKEIINKNDWVKSKTFGQYIFVGPYTSGKSYQQVRDAKLGAVNAMEKGTLFAQGATTWPSKIGTINATVYGQKNEANMPNLVSIEKGDAKITPSKAYTLNVPSVATIIESPVGMLTPKMMDNTPSQPQYSVPGACIPHPIAVYFKGTTNPAITHSAADITAAVYEAQYGPTNNIGSTNFSNGVNGYNPTSTCTTTP